MIYLKLYCYSCSQFQLRHIFSFRTLLRKVSRKWQASVRLTIGGVLISFHIDCLPANTERGWGKLHSTVHYKCKNKRCPPSCSRCCDMQGSLTQWFGEEIEVGALLAPPWRLLGSQSLNPRVILPKTGVIADDNAFRNGHARLLLPRCPISATNSVQLLARIRLYFQAVGQEQRFTKVQHLWRMIYSQGRQIKKQSSAVCIGNLALGFIGTISTKYVWLLSPPKAAPPRLPACFYAYPFIIQSYFYSTLLWQLWGALCGSLCVPYSPWVLWKHTIWI